MPCKHKNSEGRCVYLLDRFADNLLVLLLCDFLLLVEWFDGCLHFINSFLLNLLLLEQKEDIRLLFQMVSQLDRCLHVTFSFLELSACALLCWLSCVVEEGSTWLGAGWPWVTTVMPALVGVGSRPGLP